MGGAPVSVLLQPFAVPKSLSSTAVGSAGISGTNELPTGSLGWRRRGFQKFCIVYKTRLTVACRVVIFETLGTTLIQACPSCFANFFALVIAPRPEP